MNRFAKFFRVIGGMFLLVNVVLFFLPILIIRQENYATLQYSQFDFVRKLFQHGVSNLGQGMSTKQIIVVACLIVLPVLLSLIFGIIGIAFHRKQIVSGIGACIVAGCNIAFYCNYSVLNPKRLNDAQVYESGFGLKLLLIFAVLAAVFGIGSLITTPRRKKKSTAGIIPEVEEIKKEQEKPKYEFIDEAVQKQTEKEIENVAEPKSPKGVMVGLHGTYQGAEIPFHSGETLKLGRDLTNDLVFTDSKVSRFHCSLTWDENMQKYQIFDKSSNGCFINEKEECIPQNMAIYLEPGTILDIGSSENRFLLE